MLAAFYICIITLSSVMALITFYTPIALAPLHSISIGIVLTNLVGTLYLLMSGKAISPLSLSILKIALSAASILVMGFATPKGTFLRSQLIKKSKSLSPRATSVIVNQSSRLETSVLTNRSNKPAVAETEENEQIMQISGLYAATPKKLTKYQMNQRIARALIRKENKYFIGPLVVAFCTPFYFFYGLGCAINVWPEIIARHI